MDERRLLGALLDDDEGAVGERAGEAGEGLLRQTLVIGRVGEDETEWPRRRPRRLAGENLTLR